MKLRIFFSMASIVLTSVSIQAQGPQQPEFTSFESVGSTDMVNLSTGDFTYNIPLVNIPGPEGSFSLPLSYHAGIKLNQESSWVGLGWNINPGAITREVVQYPDDFSGDLITTQVYDEGNEGGSVWVPIPPLGVSLNYSWDSEKGRGGSVSFSGVTVGVGTHKGLSVMGIGSGMKTDMSGLMNIAMSMASMSSTVSKFNTLKGAGQAVNLKSLGIVGTAEEQLRSFGLQTLNHSMSSLSNRIISQNDWTINQSDYVFYNDYDIYLNHTANENMYGSLYLGKSSLNTVQVNANIASNFHPSISGDGVSVSDDNKSIKFFDSSTNNPVSDMHINSLGVDGKYWNTGGRPTSIAYDSYNVNAPMISGKIKPYRTDIGSLAFPTAGNENFIRYSPVPWQNEIDGFYKTNFMYAGTSNNYLHHIGSEGDLGETSQMGVGLYYDWVEEMNWELIDDIFYNEKIDVREDNSFVDNHLVTGEVVKWYSNSEILSGSAQLNGFIDCESMSENRASMNFDRIGGYSITSAQGMTYHFAVPVLNVQKRTFNATDTHEIRTTEINEPYATAWLLTAITGPDYVDRGILNVLDQDDWGYWVKFEYGMASMNMQWRIPYVGKSKSVFDDYKGNVETGFKQLYYLNMIQTRSHSALFVKSIKEDNRAPYVYDQVEVNTSDEATHYTPTVNDVGSTLKLDEIILLTNESYEKLRSAGLSLENGQDYDATNSNLFDKILDVKDFNEELLSMSKELQISRTSFEYDYSLCPGSDNSFSSAINPPYPGNGSGGKLTLKKIKQTERADIQLIPNFEFEYGENPYYHKDKWDGWGMYSEEGTDCRLSHKAKGNGAEWSLSKVITPIGGEIEVFYERDDYLRLIGGGKQNFSRSCTDDGYHLNEHYSINYIENHEDFGNVYEFTFFNGIPDFDESMTDFKVYVLTNVYDIDLGEIVHQTSNKLIFSKHQSEFIHELWPAFHQFMVCESDAKKGGDIRVNKIKISDEYGNSSNTVYSYVDKNGRSTGVCSVEPMYIRLNSGTTSEKINIDYNYDDKNSDSYSSYYNEYDYPALPIMYSNVNVYHNYNTGNYSLNEEFDFETVEENNLIINVGEAHEGFSFFTDYNTQTYNGGVNIYPRTRNITVEVNTSKIGRLNSHRKYTSNNQLIYSLENQYSQGNEFSGLGVYTEGSLLAERMQISPEWSTSYISGFERLFIRFLRTTKIYNPSILKSVTINEGGVAKTIENTQYDIVTGNVLETEYSNSLGEKYRSKVIPAYHKYPEMGSKALNPSNKNMMSQKTADYLYSTNSFGEEKVVSASVQTWNEDWMYRDFDSNSDAYISSQELNSNIWRKHKTYAWKSPFLNEDGTYDNFVDFDWETASQNSNWLSISENTLYDHFSKPLEVKDINSNYTSTKIGYGNTKTLLSSSNSRYTESYFSGAEDKIYNCSNYFGGEVKGSDKQSSEFAHTGSFSVATNTSNTNEWTNEIDPETGLLTPSIISEVGFVIEGSIGENEDFSIQDYVASVWVYSSTVENARLIYEVYNDNSLEYSSEDESLDVEIISANDWSLKQILIPVEKLNLGNRLIVLTKNSSQQIGVTCYFDDFRLHPLESTMNSYVYDEWDNLVAVLDANNIATRYTYDEAGRLKLVEREFADDVSGVGGFKKVKSSEYHYAREIE